MHTSGSILDNITNNKMENNTEAKARFFALYWGQNVFKVLSASKYRIRSSFDDLNDDDYLELKPLSSITDEDAIEVARLAHQMPKGLFLVDRKEDIIYVQTNYSKVGIQHFISIIPRYGTVCATINFNATDKEPRSSHTVNIGQISLSDSRPVPYIAIVDYLRSKGYAIPFHGLAVNDMVSYGWIKLKQETNG